MNTIRSIVAILPTIIGTITTSGCAAQEPILIPRTNMKIETLAFGPNQGVTLAGPNSLQVICRDGDMTPDFSVPSIYFWTGTIFEDLRKTDPDLDKADGCRFGVYSAKRYAPRDSDIETDECISRYTKLENQIQSIEIFVKADTKSAFFRALHLPEHKLFKRSNNPQTDYGLPAKRNYSPIMPAPFIHLQYACRRISHRLFRPHTGQSPAELNQKYRLQCSEMI
jgi:hypothetical protein